MLRREQHGNMGGVAAEHCVSRKAFSVALTLPLSAIIFKPEFKIGVNESEYPQ